jgi:hypothetical protein
MEDIESFCKTHREGILKLETKFGGYRTGIDRYDIRSWIQQFKREHYGLALKLLNSLNYYDQARVIRESELLFSQLKAMNQDIPNETCFASFTPAGHSGDTLLPYYRDGSGLRHHRYDCHFINISDLASEGFSQTINTFVLIDDFVGTGRQALERWENIQSFFYEKDVGEVFLSVLIGYEEAIRKIEEKTNMTVIANQRLSPNDKIFSLNNKIFSPQEKVILREYCRNTGDLWPEGHGECQSNVVFFYRSPNNTISIIRCDMPKWKGLFLRY